MLPLHKSLVFLIVLLVLISSTFLSDTPPFFLKCLLASRLILFFRFSTLFWFRYYNYCILSCFLWSKNPKHASANHGLCRFSSYGPRLPLTKDLIICLMFSPILFMSLISFKFSKAAKPFEILICYCFVTHISFTFLALQLSRSEFFYLLLKFPYLSKLQDSGNYHGQIPCKIVHWIYLNTISYLLLCVPSDCESSHQERFRCTYECFCAGTSCS